MDETWNYAKSDKPHTKGQMLYGLYEVSIYVLPKQACIWSICNNQIHREKKNVAHQGLEEGARGVVMS